MIYNHEKKKSIEKVPEMMDTLGLSYEDFKTPIINMSKNLKEKIDLMSKQMGMLSRETETVFKNPMEILELKNTSVLGHGKEKGL